MQAQRSSSYFSNIKNSAETIWEGMSITLSYMFRRPITVQYPDRTEVPVKDTLPDRYRGFLEVDMAICTACKACERDCPIDCIRIDIEGKGKERMMQRFDIDLAKCMFCGLCTENCPTGSIQHTAEFEATAISMENLTFRFVPDPLAGVKPYKPEKGVDSYPRVPLGSIVQKIIRPWNSAPPRFSDADITDKTEAKPVNDGPSKLAPKAIGVDGAVYAKVLEEAMAGTDCEACGYPTCQEYSEAIAGGDEEKLSLCEPGGKATEEEVKQIVGAHGVGVAPAGIIKAAPVIGAVVDALKKLNETAAAAEPAAPASPPSPDTSKPDDPGPEA